MIKTEIITTAKGTELVRTYSDDGHKIIQNGTGAVYDEAVDPADSGRTYEESEELIEVTEDEPEDLPFGRLEA